MVNDFRTWHACEHPERRPDQDCHFHIGCEPCAVAYEAQQYPPPPGEFQGWYEHWDQKLLDGLRGVT